MKDELTSIGGASRATGVHIETIRYYERIGVMPAPRRSEAGHRAYDGVQVRRLRFVRRSRELGFGLDRIRAMLRLADDGALTCGEIHAITVDHLAEVQRKIADLRKLERVLGTISADCSRGEVPDCPVVDALFGEGRTGPVS